MNDSRYDLVGVGCGPFNLSIAALADEAAQAGRPLKTCFFDARPEFEWHPGMMLPGSSLQTSCFKDLVTPVKPTSRWSFMNYLVAHRRFYRFLHADMKTVSRAEFADYLRWVAEQLPNVHFGCRVSSVRHEGDYFRISVDGLNQPVFARSLCVGTGLQPKWPCEVSPEMASHITHSHDLSLTDFSCEGQTVVVIGGGQSGAEIVLNLLRHHWGASRRILWITRRPTLSVLDDSHFVNEFFTPAWMHAFVRLDLPVRQRLVAEQKMASDGISGETLKELYQLLYRMSILTPESLPEILVGRSVRSMKARNRRVLIQTEHLLCGESEWFEADRVICATGYDNRYPSCLDQLKEYLPDSNPLAEAENLDFEVPLKGSGPRLFRVNSGRVRLGIAEPQMSLMAWRAARIINAVLGDSFYSTEPEHSFVGFLPAKERGRENAGKSGESTSRGECSAFPA
ncbi:SidA/IucD/PvdA family monooxygenase [Hahella sp. SMD15-11]|uniref:SidA/IucD/PvdA family monooxygenase n=1 Tax=Thermohahella caldifontis TaxID=3142973 RepID=A0AB39US83_9GAMM